MHRCHQFLRLRLGKWALIVTLLALSLTGCAQQGPYGYNGTGLSNPYLYEGAALGGALGAGLGAAINHSNPWRGAAIGGLLGAGAGGIAGEVYRRSNPYPSEQPGYYQQPPQPQPPYSPPPS